MRFDRCTPSQTAHTRFNTVNITQMNVLLQRILDMCGRTKESYSEIIMVPLLHRILLQLLSKNQSVDRRRHNSLSALY